MKKGVTKMSRSISVHESYPLEEFCEITGIGEVGVRKLDAKAAELGLKFSVIVGNVKQIIGRKWIEFLTKYEGANKGSAIKPKTKLKAKRRAATTQAT